MTAVKDNQPTMHDDLENISWSESDRCHETLGKGHGRAETLKTGEASEETRSAVKPLAT